MQEEKFFACLGCGQKAQLVNGKWTAITDNSSCPGPVGMYTNAEINDAQDKRYEEERREIIEYNKKRIFVELEAQQKEKRFAGLLI